MHHPAGRREVARMTGDEPRRPASMDELRELFGAGVQPADANGRVLLLDLLAQDRDGRSAGFIGRQLVKMYRKDGKWQSTNQFIYDSIIYPLAKAAESERVFEEDSSSDSEVQPWYLPTFTYILPVLVTAGTIYTVDVMSGDSPIVAEAK